MRWTAIWGCGSDARAPSCQSDCSSARLPRFLSRLSSPTLEIGDAARSVARRGIARRSEKCRYTHLQRQGDEHSGSGNKGAASLKKRLSHSASIARHGWGPATTLTACHGCLIDAGSFVFVTIRQIPSPFATTTPEICGGLITLRNQLRNIALRVSGVSAQGHFVCSFARL